MVKYKQYVPQFKEYTVLLGPTKLTSTWRLTSPLVLHILYFAKSYPTTTVTIPCNIMLFYTTMTLTTNIYRLCLGWDLVNYLSTHTSHIYTIQSTLIPFCFLRQILNYFNYMIWFKKNIYNTTLISSHKIFLLHTCQERKNCNAIDEKSCYNTKPPVTCGSYHYWTVIIQDID